MVFAFVLAAAVYHIRDGVGRGTVEGPAIGNFAGVVIVSALGIVNRHQRIAHHHVVDVVPVDVANADTGVGPVGIRNIFAELKDIEVVVFENGMVGVDAH